MAAYNLKTWETLFQRALELIESAQVPDAIRNDWTFGGGTVLMRRYMHRFSKDVDIFVPDPQWLGFLTPRLNAKAESITSNYIEQVGFLKLYFPEGEIDFVASNPLTKNSSIPETLFERSVLVETSTEIIAKKVWHRGEQFTARDMFDLALVTEKEPKALLPIKRFLHDRRTVVMERIGKHEAVLRETFDALEVLDFKRSYDECLDLVKKAFS